MSNRIIRYVRRARRWAALTFPIFGYAPTAAGTALEARAEPPAHRKEAGPTEAAGTHEHEGERDAPSTRATGEGYAASSSTEAASMIVEHAAPLGSLKIIA